MWKTACSTDILDTAAATGRFRTLLAALESAGVAARLRGQGPFTVLAPSDEAFRRIGETLDAVLADQQRLAAVLEHHVIPGKLMTWDLAQHASVDTLLGSRLRLATTPGVRVEDARVLESDIETSNGVIHVIDTVLLQGAQLSKEEGAVRTEDLAVRF